ncbi:MAG TPA: aminotransferase [Firmicutes bacterium]|jgi:cysteine desulfurase / selenocysteine lyase|nr:aminotransferase [Bacillota bacterium]
MDFSDLIYGYEKKVPTQNGFKRYINFDNAASTPPFKGVMDHLLEEALWYSSIHRGSGFKSLHSTAQYESARQIVAEFIGADLSHDIIIFTKNTTDSLNKLSHYLSVLPGEIVVFTKLEHHSNELPWLKAKSLCIGLKDGVLDLGELERVLRVNRGRIKLLAVSGASNVTGYMPPIDTLAEMAHQAGAKIVVDGAQLVPHRPVKIYSSNDPRHLDFLAFSGHKMYAPFGTGVLVGPREIFNKKSPSQVGGGTVKGIGPAGIIWANPPETEEAGSPNVLGALALAKASQILQGIGWDMLIRHETSLLYAALNKIQKIPKINIYGIPTRRQIGVISFNIQGCDHANVAKYLAEKKGIGVRSGCFCARSYVQTLLKLNPCQLQANQEKLIQGIEWQTPGMVRISFGCYNNMKEVDCLVEALQEFCDS